MDETTKIFIGTISGFIIAFFAEPVKIYLNNNSKKKALRLALYKEMMSNIKLLAIYLKGDHTIFTPLQGSLFRYETFNYILNNEVGIFFQIKESMEIREFYILLQSITSEKSIKKKKIYLEHLRYVLLQSIKNNILDRKLFMKIQQDVDGDLDLILENLEGMV